MNSEPRPGHRRPKKGTIIKFAGAATAAAALGVGAFVAEKKLPRFIGSSKHITDVASAYSPDVQGALDLIETSTVAHREVAGLERNALAAVLSNGRDAHIKEIRGTIRERRWPQDWDPLTAALRVLEAKGALEHPPGSGHEFWQPTSALLSVLSNQVDYPAAQLREQIEAYRNQPPEEPYYEVFL